jgi:hypothetical protein
MDEQGKMIDHTAKVYKYRTMKYLLSSIGPVLMMLFFLVLGIIGMRNDPNNGLYQALVIVLPVLLLFEIFALNQPGKITDDGEKISFYAYGRSHHFKWSELTYLKIKRFPLTSKVHLRIGRNNFLKGRYWFFPKELTNGQELMGKLDAWERKLHQAEDTRNKGDKETIPVKTIKGLTKKREKN